ncbi:conserved hypothetical protein, secreted [Candidatus Magnetomorum sp. HK-1]|nr:conserved hypothetical protein, secreted [Candidatus Magnetomorum sp. HK-1]
MIKKGISFLFVSMIVLCAFETYAGQWEYSFYRHQDKDEVIFSEGGGSIASYMSVSARINTDNTISVTVTRSNGERFPRGTLFLLKDTWDNFPMYDPDNVQASDSVDNIVFRTLTSNQNLDVMPAEWDGSSQGGIMNMYVLYENETDYSWIGPITIQRTPVEASSYLIVNLSPPSAITDGAEWRISDGSIITRWYKSGEILEEPMIAGDYTIEFKQLTHLGWKSRSAITVSLEHEKAITKSVYYFKDDKGCIQGITYPESVGGQWCVELSGKECSEWYFSGEIMPDIEPGQKNIVFREIADWVKPDDVTIVVNSNKTAVAQGLYCKKIPNQPADVKTLSGLYENKIVISWTQELCELKHEIMRGTVDNPSDADNTTVIVSEYTGNLYEDTAVKAGTRYYYWIRAYHIYGESGLTDSVQGFVKLQQPENIQATNCSVDDSEKIRITFSAVPGATAYEIWRGTVNNPGLASYLGKTNETYYDDSSGIYEKTYYYWIKAINSELNTKSEMSQFWAMGCKRMPSVTNVRATDGTDSKVVIVTFEPIPDAARHNIDYKLHVPTDTSNIDKKYLIRNTQNSLVDYTAIAGKSQFYRVVAYNGYGSRISAPDAGWKKMAAVQNLSTINADRPGTVHLKWDKVDDASGHIILRSAVDNIQYAEDIGSTMQVEYIDNAAGQEYYYWIKAFNEYTDSLPAKSVHGKPNFCEYSIDPSTIRMDAKGGAGIVQINANFDTCEWHVTNNLHWITFTQAIGVGTANATFTMKASDLERNGSVMIGGDGTSPYNNNQKQLLFEQYVDYTLHIDAIGEGKIKINDVLQDLPYEQVFDSGEQLDIQAVPVESGNSCIINSFDKWVVSGSSSPDATVLMDQDHLLTAQFIQMTSLNILIEDAGFVKVNDNTIDQNAVFEYPFNTAVTLKATPKEDSTFLGWSVNHAPTLIESAQLDISLTQCYDVKAVFDSGWEMAIQSSRGNFSPEVSIGVKSTPTFLDMPPLPPGYETSISINRYYENDWVTSGAVDIRQKPDNDLLFNYQYWGLSVNPHGPSGGPLPTVALVSWDSKNMDKDYMCQVLSGYTIDSEILIADMREITQFKVIGNNEIQYFTIRCRNIPAQPTIMINSQNNEGLSHMSVSLNTGSVINNVAIAPSSPEFSCYLALIPVPDWNNKLSLQVFEQAKDSYNWVIAVNPHGNVGGPQESTSILRWDMSNFNEGNIGFWKLIEGPEPDGKVLIQDMKQVQEMEVTGVNETIYFVVHWSRYWEFDMNAGWNLFSLPVVSDNMSVNHLFENASAVYSFVDGGYELVNHIEPCKGYWVKLPEPKTYKFYGNPVNTCTKELSDGWHLIGSMFGKITPTSIPDNKISSIFKYEDGGYTLVDKLLPGFGYWLKLTETATLKYNSEQ